MSSTFMKSMTFLAAVAALTAPGLRGRVIAADAPASAAPASSDTRDFTVVSVEVNDTKFWLPSAIAVEQGDKVKLTLKNQVPGAVNTHGFTIPGYNITEVVTRGTPKTVTFVADKAGVFPFSCQLHPAHVGGVLIVEPKK